MIRAILTLMSIITGVRKNSSLNRREFLKLAALSMAGLAFRDFPPGNDPYNKGAPTFTLGRTIYSLRYYDRPSVQGKELGFYVSDTVIHILEQALGDPEPVHNPIWLRTEDGWLHSAYVQPVRDELNEPLLTIPSGGLLMEVTVPFTQVYLPSERGWQRKHRLYYASTHWVHYAFKLDTGDIWYQVYDDRAKTHFVAKGEHFRPITAEELTQISPGVPGKRIEVDLKRQRIIAYEGSQPVFTARTATGYFPGDTPQGEYRIERKQPTRHMASDLEGNEFDLPGVPWVCYISWTGVSLHGTYWHNNYGTPQSHGCINLSPEAAKWIYRWTDPFVPVNEDFVASDQGTRVIVY